MRRFVRSSAYARVKLASAALFVLFGIVVEVRTVLSVGIVGQAVPAYVLGAALIALGVVRYRDYFAMTGSRPR